MIFTFCCLNLPSFQNSYEDSSLFLFSLQYCNDIMLLLCCVETVLLMFCMPLFQKLWMFMLILVIIIEIFSSLFNSYSLVWSVFVTPISKLNTSTYLSGAFQSKVGCLKAGPPCLHLCAPPSYASIVYDVGLASASLSTHQCCNGCEDSCLNCCCLGCI